MLFFAVLEYAILASTFTIAKIAIGHADPLFLIGVRMVVASPLMLLIHSFQRHSSMLIKRADCHWFFLVGIFHVFLPFIGEFWALQYVSSAKTAITYSLTPFIAAMLSFLLLKKQISKTQMLGLVIGLLGLLPIFASGDEISYLAGEFLSVSVPEVVLLLSVTSASYAWFIVADLMGKGYGISFINGVAMLIGGVLSFILWWLVGDPAPINGSVSDFMLWTGLLILVANVISYNFYGWLLRHMSINLMSAVGFLCPVFASIYGLVLLDEKLGASHLIALLMVGIGIYLFYREEVRKSAKNTG